MKQQGKPLVIGGPDFLLTELLTWHPAHLAGLVLKYQDFRRTWHQADEVSADYIEALEIELQATKRERDGLLAELRQWRGVQMRRVA